MISNKREKSSGKNFFARNTRYNNKDRYCLTREIERLEAEIKKIKADHTSQIRQLSHRTATTAMDKQQMEQLLGDSRRENQLLRDELYTLRETTEKLKEEKVRGEIIILCELIFGTELACIITDLFKTFTFL